MLIDKTTNIKLDGVEVSRILDTFGTVLYEHQSVPPKFLSVTVDEDVTEYGDDKYIQIDGGDPIYLTEPLYLNVTNATSITGDAGSKAYAWEWNGYVGTRFLHITQDDLNEGDNMLKVIAFG